LRTEEPSKAASEDQTILRLQIELAKAWQDYVQNEQAYVQKEFSGLLGVFYLLNGGVAALVAVFAVFDAYMVYHRPPEAHYQRLITDKVIMALIAASAAQLGSLAVAVGTQLLRLRNAPVSPVGSKAAVIAASDLGATTRLDTLK